MFRVGDYIAYPMHGAGRIEAIEERGDEGTKQNYYCLHFYDDDLKIMVPVHRAIEVGMRQVIDPAQAETVFSVLSERPGAEDSNWNRRYRANLDKLRTGAPSAIAQVLSALSARNRARGLSASEKKILLNARRFLIGEMLLSGVGSEQELNDRVDDCLSLASQSVIEPKAQIG